MDGDTRQAARLAQQAARMPLLPHNLDLVCEALEALRRQLWLHEFDDGPWASDLIRVEVAVQQLDAKVAQRAA